MKIRLSLICLAALAPAMAMANIIPTATTITGTGPYVWSYNLQLAPDQDAIPGAPPTSTPVPLDLTIGSLVTIYDFDGYVAGTCVGPAGWVCTAQNVGFTPNQVMPVDNLDIVNLTWVYTTGSTPLTGAPGGFDLGTFSAQSIYNTITQVSYASRAIKNSGATQSGTIGDNVGFTDGPTSRAIPEPGSLALAGLGLLGLGLVRRRKGY